MRSEVSGVKFSRGNFTLGELARIPYDLFISFTFSVFFQSRCLFI